VVFFQDYAPISGEYQRPFEPWVLKLRFGYLSMLIFQQVLLLQIVIHLIGFFGEIFLSLVAFIINISE
jgi:predicted CDP-diglyceride synthetase/phosphatidate cytidylyltransferase